MRHNCQLCLRTGQNSGLPLVVQRIPRSGKNFKQHLKVGVYDYFAYFAFVYAVHDLQFKLG